MKYYSIKGTPLAFHNFFRFFSLPMGILITINQLITECDMVYDIGIELVWLLYIDIFFYITHIVLCTTCFIGFFKWESYSWYCVFAFQIIGILYDCYSIIVTSIYLPDNTAMYVASLLGRVIILWLTGIYYFKRKPLFFENLRYESSDVNPDFFLEQINSR